MSSNQFFDNDNTSTNQSINNNMTSARQSVSNGGISTNQSVTIDSMSTNESVNNDCTSANQSINNDSTCRSNVRQGRKRKRDENEWKRNVAKQRRNHGKSYVTKGKIRPERKMKKGCGHG